MGKNRGGTWKAACSMAGIWAGARAARVKISSTASAVPLPAPDVLNSSDITI